MNKSDGTISKAESQKHLLDAGKFVFNNKGVILSIAGTIGSFLATWVIWYVLDKYQAHDLFIPALTDKALVIPAIIFCGILYLIGLSLLLLVPIMVWYFAIDNWYSYKIKVKVKEKALLLLFDSFPLIFFVVVAVIFSILGVLVSYMLCGGENPGYVGVVVYILMTCLALIMVKNFSLGIGMAGVMYLCLLVLGTSFITNQVAGFAGITQASSNLRYYQLDNKYKSAVASWPVHFLLDDHPVIEAYKGFQLSDMLLLCYQTDQQKSNRCLNVDAKEVMTMPTDWQPPKVDKS